MTVEKNNEREVFYSVNQSDLKGNVQLDFDNLRLNKHGDNENVISILLFKNNKRILPAVGLTKPNELSEPKFQIYRKTHSGPRLYYQDFNYQESKFDYVSESKAQDQLINTIDKLYEKEGWRCLTQVTRGISVNSSFIFNGEETTGGDRLYLIYSPFGNNKITFEPRSKSPAFAILDTKTYSFPYVRSVRKTLFYNTSTIIFRLEPNSKLASEFSQTIPVTIFTFMREKSAYAEGAECQYVASKEIEDYNRYNNITQKIILAYLFEIGRRISNANGDDITQLSTTHGRNEFVFSALKDIFPKKSDSELGYYKRIANMVLSGTLNLENLLIGGSREAVIQEINRKFPDLPINPKYIDLLIDLEIQKRNRKALFNDKK